LATSRICHSEYPRHFTSHERWRWS
jgi:hypothetical protein